MTRRSGVQRGLALVVASFVLFGCGGGGGGHVGGGGGGSASFRGAVVAGKLQNATVTIFRIDAATRALTQVQQTTTDASGSFTASVNGAGPYLAVASGGSFTDEATGTTRSLGTLPALAMLDDPRPNTMEAIFGADASGQIQATITPLSTFASQRVVETTKTGAATFSGTDVTAANLMVAKDLGIVDSSGQPVDPRTITPLDLTNPADASSIQSDPHSPAASLGAVLAGLSQAAATLGTDPVSLVTALAQDFKDGLFNGQAPNATGTGSVPVTLGSGTPLPANAGTTTLSNSVSSFLSSPQNQSGATTADFQTLITTVATPQVLPPGNIAPSFAPVADQTFSIIAGAQSVPVTGITAGVATEDNGGQTVTLTVTAADPTLFSSLTASAVTGPTGSKTATIDFTPARLGTTAITVVAKDNGGTANGGIDTFTRTFNVTITGAGIPFQLGFAVPPSTTAVVTTFTPALQVVVQDGGGVMVASVSTGTVTLAIDPAANPGSGTLLGTVTAPIVSGVAVFADVAIDNVGAGYRLIATTSGLNGATSPAFNIVPGPAVTMTFSTQPVDTTGGAVMAAVAVSFRDAFNNVTPTGTQPVTLALVGPGTLSGTKTVAPVNGVATFTTLSIDVAAAGDTLQASASGFTTIVSNSFNVNVGAAARLAFQTQPTQTNGGAAIAAFTVVVQDAGGNLVTGATNSVSLAIGFNPSAGTLSGTTSVAASGGIATFSNAKIDKAGVGYTLVASSTGLVSATSGAFDITVGPAASLAFTTQPPTTIAAVATFTPAPQVSVIDLGGNVVTGAAFNITLTIGTNPGGGTLAGTTVVAPVNGVATFSNLSIDKAGVGYTLNADGGALPTATSNAITVQTGAASRLAFSVQPPASTASVATFTIAVQVLDAGGNLVTAPSQSVSLAIGTNPGGGTLSGGGAVASSAGVATFSNVSIDKAGTGYTLVANATGLSSATSSSFDVTVGPATHLAFTTQPSTTTSLTAIAPAPVVAVLDAGGNVVTSSSASVSVAIASGPGTFGGGSTTSVAASSGLASFGNLLIDKAGTYTLSATSSGLTGATSGTFVINVGAAAQLVFTAQPPATTASVTSFAVAVTVQDAGGNTVTGAAFNVTLGVGTNPGAGTLLGTTSVAPSAGVATFSVSVDKAGVGYTLTADGNGLPQATSSPFTVNVGTATRLAFSVSPSNAASVTTLTPAAVVRVEDAGGNLVTSGSVSVTMAIGTNPPGNGLLVGTKTVATSGGTATFANLSIDKAGTGYTLRASSGGLADGVSASFNISVGPPTRLVFVQQPASAGPGATISPAVQVAIEDVGGNVLTGSTDSISLTIGQNPASGTLTGGGPVGTTNGVAAFAGLSIDNQGNGYTLIAASNTLGLPSVESTPFSIGGAGIAAKLVVTTQPAASIAALTTFSPAVTVEIQDVFGTVVASANNQVTLAIASNPGSGSLFGGFANVTPVSGVATFNNISVDKAGAGYTLTATAAGLQPTTTNPFTIVPGAAAKLAFTTQPSGTAAVTTLSPAPVVAIQDAGGNVVSSGANVTVAIASGPGGATLSGTLTVPAAAGFASFANLSLDKAGGYTLRATSGVLAAGTSSSFSISVGAATGIVFAVQPPASVAALTTFVAAPRVAIVDAGGNVVTSRTDFVTLSFGSNPSGGSLFGTTNGNCTNGAIDFTNVSVDKAGSGYTLVAACAGFANATSQPFAVTFGAAARLVFTQQPPNVAAVASFGTTVTIVDLAGNTVTSASNQVTLSIANNPGGGTLSGPFQKNAVAGVALFASLTIDKAGVGYTLAANASGLTGTTSSGFDVTVGPATRVIFTQNPSANVTATQPFNVTASIADAGGNVVAGRSDTITIAISTNPSGGVLQGVASGAAANSSRTFTLSIAKAGSPYVLSAQASGLATGFSTSFAVVAGSPASIAFVQQPTNALPGVVISPSVQVAVIDSGGNVVAGATDSIAVVISANPAGGTLSGTTPRSTNAGGIAVFNDLSIDQGGVGYSLAAISQSLFPGLTITSQSFNITSAGVPAKLAFLVQPSTYTQNRLMRPPIVRVAVEDVFGTVCSQTNATIQAALVNGGGATLGGSTQTFTTNGVGSFESIWIDLAGSGYQLNVTAAGLSSATSTAFQVSPPPSAAWARVTVPAFTGLRGRGLANDGATLYAAGNGGVFKSTDSGASWKDVTNGLRDTSFSTVIIDKNSLAKDVYVVGNNSGVWRSRDGGATWTLSLAATSSNAVLGAAPSYAGVLYAAFGSQVFSTADGGTTWNARSSVGLPNASAPTGIAVAAFGNPLPLWISFQNSGVFQSNDSGDHFSAINTNLSDLDVQTLIYETTTAKLHAGTSGSGVFSTSAFSVNWAPTATGLGSFLRIEALAFDPKAQGTLYASARKGGGTGPGGQALFKKTSATQWVESDTALPLFISEVTALAVDAENPSLVYTNVRGQGVFKSVNGAGSWSASTTGITLPQVLDVKIDASNPNNIYATAANRIVYSNDGGSTWLTPVTGPSGVGVLAGLAIDSAGRVFAGADNGIWRSTDSGAHWTLNSGTTFTAQLVLPALPAVEPGTNKVYVGQLAGNNTVYISSDNGQTFTPRVGTGLPVNASQGNAPCGAVLKMVFTAANTAFALVQDGSGAGQDGIYKTTDGGSTWTAFNSGLVQPQVDFGQLLTLDAGGTLYFADGSKGVFRSPSASASWTAANGTLPPGNGAAAILGGAANTVYVYSTDHNANGAMGAGDQGLWKTTDGGTTWSPITNGLGGDIQCLAVNAAGTLIFAGGEDAGLVLSNTSGLDRAVDPTLCSLVALPTTLTAGGTTTVTVTIRDASNQPLAGRTVVFSSTGTSNHFTQPVATGTNGVAVGSFQSNTPETKTVTATVSPGPGSVTIAQTAIVTFTTNAALSDSITLNEVEGLVSGDEQFKRHSEELGAAVANDPTNENAKLAKALSDALGWTKDNLFDTNPSVGKVRDMFRRAGFRNRNEASGLLRDFHIERDPSFVPTSSPTGNELLAFVNNDLTPQVDTLITRFSAIPNTFTYHVNVDSAGHAFDGSSLDDTRGLDLTYGDIQLGLAHLQGLKAAIHGANGYDLANMKWSDLDVKATPPADALANVGNLYPTAGTVLSPAELMAAQTGLNQAFTTYKSAADFIRGETTAQINSGLVTLGRGATTATIDSRLDAETKMRAFVQGMLDSSFVNSNYTFTTSPDGKTFPPSTVNLFPFFAGNIDLRTIFLKTVDDPIKGKRLFGVTDLSQLGSQLLTAGGVVTQVYGQSPSTGDARRWFKHGTAYAVRVDAPPSSTKTIDGTFADWGTPGVDYVRVGTSPVATVRSDSTTGAHTDFGALDIAVDGNFLYVRSTADLSQSSGPIIKHKIDVEGPSGRASVNYDAKNPLNVGSTVADTTNFNVGDAVTNGSATGTVTFVNKPSFSGQVADATFFNVNDFVDNGAGATGVVTFAPKAVTVSPASSGIFNQNDQVNNGAGATGQVTGIPQVFTALQAPVFVGIGDTVNDGLGATGTLTSVGTAVIGLQIPSATGFNLNDSVDNGSGATGNIQSITPPTLFCQPNDFTALNVNDQVNDGNGATGTVQSLATFQANLTSATGFAVGHNVNNLSGATGVVTNLNGTQITVRITFGGWLNSGSMFDVSSAQTTTYTGGSMQSLQIVVSSGTWQPSGTINDTTASTVTTYSGGFQSSAFVNVGLTSNGWSFTTGTLHDNATNTTTSYSFSFGGGPSVTIRISGGSWGVNGTVFDPAKGVSSSYSGANITQLQINVTGGVWGSSGNINDTTSGQGTTYSGGAVLPTGINLRITGGVWAASGSIHDSNSGATSTYQFGSSSLANFVRFSVTSGSWPLPAGAITDTTTGGASSYSNGSLGGTFPVLGTVSPPTVSAYTASGFEVAVPLSNFGSDTYVALTRSYNGVGASCDRADRVIIKIR